MMLQQQQDQQDHQNRHQHQHPQQQQQQQMKRLRERDEDGESGDNTDSNTNSNSNSNKKVKLTVVVAKATATGDATATRDATAAAAAAAAKRRMFRTEQYLEELERHENVQRTCKFFLDGLTLTLAKGKGKAKQQHHQNTVDPESAAAENDTFANVSLLHQNLRRETTDHHAKFVSKTISTLSHAQESIQLKHSMTNIIGRAVFSAADDDGVHGDSGRDNGCDNCKHDGRPSSKGMSSSSSPPPSSTTSSSLLRRLNNGRETSQALFDKISSYVGVLSDDDIVDCQHLVKVITTTTS